MNPGYKSQANIKTRIGKLFAASNKDLNPYTVLMKARQRIIDKDDQAFKNLEDELNKWFSNQFLEKNNGQTIFYNSLERYIQNNIDLAISSSGKKGSFIGEKQHSSYIVLRTIQKRCIEMKEILNNLSPKQVVELFKEDRPNTTKQKLLNLINLWNAETAGKSEEDLMKHFSNVVGKNKYKDFMEAVQDFDLIYNIVHSINADLGQVYGEGLEKGLTVLNQYINKSAAITSHNLTKATFTKAALTGSEMANRGKLSSNFFNTTLEVPQNFLNSERNIIGSKGDRSIIKIWDNIDDDNTTTINNIVGEGNQYYQINGAFQETQGKVDVIFTLPEYQDSPFRISAKSWSSMDRDFGETSLQNALLRTVNLDQTLEYGLVVGYYDARGQMYDWVLAHEFAKACALVDIVMGYSQKNNYADTIVIQNRSNPTRPILVYSIDKILRQAQAVIDRMQVEGYDNGSIAQKLTLPSSLNSENFWWMSHLLSTMHSIKLSISFKNLKNLI